MKVYAIRNPDGLTESMVAAKTLHEAADALGTSVRNLRILAWASVKGAGASPALKQPGHPVHRSIAGTRPGPWSDDRMRVLAEASRAALKRGAAATSAG